MTVRRSENVVSLPVDPAPVIVPTSRPGRLHGLAITGMALSALVGVASMFAFITVSWPGNTSRFVIAVFVGAVLCFLVCAAAAVFVAARDTYARRSDDREMGE